MSDSASTLDLFAALSHVDIPRDVLDLLARYKDCELEDVIFGNSAKIEVDIPLSSDSYTRIMKEFALILYFYSDDAFKHVRKIFHLPHPSILRDIVTSSDGQPGFSREVFEELPLILNENPEVKDCALLVDKIELTSKHSYDYHSRRYFGLVNFGGIPTPDPCELATSALVFQINSFKGSFRCPLAYFLTADATNSYLLAKLIRTCITKMNAAGFAVHSLTTNGLGTMWDVYKILGCTLEEKLTTFFNVASNKTPIFIFFDPRSMLNLCCEVLAERGEIESKDGSIEFRFVKLLCRHIKGLIKDSRARNMQCIQLSYLYRVNTKLRTELLSKEMADAMEFLLQNQHTVFLNCSTTIFFIRVVETLFRMLSAKVPDSHEGDIAVTLPELPNWADTLNSVFEYISGLKIDGIPILIHVRKLFAIGMLCNIVSVRLLAAKLIKECGFNSFCAYKITLDELHLVFTKSDFSMNDCTEKQSALEFKNKFVSVSRKCMKENSLLSTTIIEIKQFLPEHRKTVFREDSWEEELYYKDSQKLSTILNSNLNKMYDISSQVYFYLLNCLIYNISCAECVSLLFDDSKENYTMWEFSFCVSKDVVILINLIESKLRVKQFCNLNTSQQLHYVLHETHDLKMFNSHKCSKFSKENHSVQLIILITAFYLSLRLVPTS